MARSFLLYGLIFGGITAFGCSAIINEEIGQMALGGLVGLICMFFSPFRKPEIIICVCLAIGIGLIAKMGILGMGIFGCFAGSWLSGYAWINSKIS